jgi:hypothetical protein
LEAKQATERASKNMKTLERSDPQNKLAACAMRKQKSRAEATNVETWMAKEKKNNAYKAIQPRSLQQTISSM